MTPVGRSGVGRGRKVTAEGLQSGECRSGQGTKRRCEHRHPAQSMNEQSEGTAGGGSPRAGRIETAGSPTARSGTSGTEAGLKHQAGASRTERSSTEMAPLTGTSRGKCSAPPGLEHPGQAEGTRNRGAPGTGAPGDGRPGPGSSEAEMTAYVPRRPKGTACMQQWKRGSELWDWRIWEEGKAESLGQERPGQSREAQR